MERQAKRILSYTIAARAGGRARDPFPLTGSWVQRVSKAIGHPVGEHRALEIAAEIKKSYLRQVGSYRSKKHGFRVALFRLRRPLRSSVRTRRDVKWWKHPLFGTAGVTPDYQEHTNDWREWWGDG